MKKYFEYEFNENIKKRLLELYEKEGNGMDGSLHSLKIDIKLERAKKYITFSKKDKILDVGCSGGAVLTRLANSIDTGTGIDLSKSIITHNRKYNKLKNINYRTFDGVNIEEENYFDKIFLLDVLEHAFEPDALMKSIYKALKKSGQLIIQVPTTGWLSELIFGKYHLGHLRYYDENYLGKFGQEYQVLHTHTFNSVPFSSFFLRYKHLYQILNSICKIIPHKLFPYYGSVMAVVIKK